MILQGRLKVKVKSHFKFIWAWHKCESRLLNIYLNHQLFFEFWEWCVWALTKCRHYPGYEHLDSSDWPLWSGPPSQFLCLTNKHKLSRSRNSKVVEIRNCILEDFRKAHYFDYFDEEGCFLSRNKLKISKTTSWRNKWRNKTVLLVSNPVTWSSHSPVWTGATNEKPVLLCCP